MQNDAKVSEMFGDSPEETKNTQERALVRLYRKQLITTITTCCLVRKKGYIGYTDDYEISVIGRPPDYLEEMGDLSKINPRIIARALFLLEDEEALTELQKLMDQIHQNCVQIAQKLEIDFKETRKEVGKM